MRLTIGQLRSLIKEELTHLNEVGEAKTWCNIVYFMKVAIKSLDECNHYLTLTGDYTVQGSSARDTIRSVSIALQDDILSMMERKVRGRCDVSDQASFIRSRDLPTILDRSKALNRAHASLQKASTNLSKITLSTDKQGNQFVDQLGPDLYRKYHEIVNGIYGVQSYVKSCVERPEDSLKSEGHRRY